MMQRQAPLCLIPLPVSVPVGMCPHLWQEGVCRGVETLDQWKYWKIKGRAGQRRYSKGFFDLIGQIKPSFCAATLQEMRRHEPYQLYNGAANNLACVWNAQTSERGFPLTFTALIFSPFFGCFSYPAVSPESVNLKGGRTRQCDPPAPSPDWGEGRGRSSVSTTTAARRWAPSRRRRTDRCN